MLRSVSSCALSKLDLYYLTIGRPLKKDMTVKLQKRAREEKRGEEGEEERD